MDRRGTLVLAAATACLLVITGLSNAFWSASRQADFQAALDLLARGPKLELDAGEYSLLHRAVFVRASQPSERMVEKSWGQSSTVTYRFEQRDAATGKLIILMQRTPSEMRLHDPRNNVDIAYPNKPPQPSGAPVIDTRPRPNSVFRLAASDWRKPALVLHFYNDVRGDEHREFRQKMREDYRLRDIVALQTEKVIDRASGYDVRFEWWVVTSHGQRMLLQRVLHEPPRVGKLSELPPDWFDIPANVKRVPLLNG